MPYLNERMLYQFQWGYRKEGRSLDEYRNGRTGELRPVLRAHPGSSRSARTILEPQAAYGYWPCAAEGNDVSCSTRTGDARSRASRFPRQNKEGGLCIADFFRDIDDAASAT